MSKYENNLQTIPNCQKRLFIIILNDSPRYHDTTVTLSHCHTVVYRVQTLSNPLENWQRQPVRSHFHFIFQNVILRLTVARGRGGEPGTKLNQSKDAAKRGRRHTVRTQHLIIKHFLWRVLLFQQHNNTGLGTNLPHYSSWEDS